MAKLIIPVIPVAREIMERLAKARGNLVQKKVEVKTRRGTHYRMQWVKPENDRAWSEKEQPGLFDDDAIPQPEPKPAADAKTEYDKAMAAYSAAKEARAYIGNINSAEYKAASKKLESASKRVVAAKKKMESDKTPKMLDRNEDIRALGVARITDIGDENVYVEKDGKEYFFKPAGDTYERYEVGEYDFSNEDIYSVPEKKQGVDHWRDSLKETEANIAAIKRKIEENKNIGGHDPSLDKRIQEEEEDAKSLRRMIAEAESKPAAAKQKTQAQLMEEMTDNVDELEAMASKLDSKSIAIASIVRNPSSVSNENLKKYSDFIKGEAEKNTVDKYDDDRAAYVPAMVAAQKLRVLAVKALADEKAKRAAMKAEGQAAKQKDAEGALENSAGGKYRVEKNKYGTYDLQYKGPRGQNWKTVSGQMAVTDKLESEMDDALRLDNEAVEKLNDMGLFDAVRKHFTEYPPHQAFEVVQIMKKKIDEKQIGRIMDTLDNPANKLSRSVFEAITGKKIEGKGGHEKAVEEHFGKDAMDAWRGEVQRETADFAVKQAELKRKGIVADVERIKYRDPKSGGIITAKELIDGYMKDAVSIKEYKRGAISVMWIEGPGGAGPEFKSKAEKDYVRMLQAEKERAGAPAQEVKKSLFESFKEGLAKAFARG